MARDRSTPRRRCWWDDLPRPFDAAPVPAPQPCRWCDDQTCTCAPPAAPAVPWRGQEGWA